MCFSFFLLFFWLTNTYLETKRKVNLCFVPVYDWKKKPQFTLRFIYIHTKHIINSVSLLIQTLH